MIVLYKKTFNGNLPKTDTLEVYLFKPSNFL